MQKKCPVVLLPTKNILDNGAQLHLAPNKARLVFPVTGAEGRKLRQEGLMAPNFKPQHLYICSNDEIKVGDWVYYNIHVHNSTAFKEIFQYDGIRDKKLCLKIIATTDSSLTITIPKGADYESNTSLPSIPQSFINRYIKACNEGKPITSVMVEYIVDTDGDWNYNPENDGKLFYIPKLNGNEIIINNYK